MLGKHPFVTLPAKDRFIQERLRIAMQDKQAMAKPYASPINKGEEHYVMEEEVGRGCLQQNSVGEKQEFIAMMVSQWLSGRCSQCLIGATMYIFPSWGACN